MAKGSVNVPGACATETSAGIMSAEDKAKLNLSGTVITGTLLSDAWSADKPYQQDVAMDGLGADDNGVIGMNPSATEEQREEARDAILCVIGQADGIVTIAADGLMPDEDIPIAAIIIS